jgi:RNA polymerase sigma factor (sigma-70 family)
MRHIVRTLLRFASQPEHPGAGSDPELLARFTHTHDQEAFAAIVDRHGPMVLGVARRILRDHDSADDVFQATFLALARSASAVHRPGGLPAWLHRTAVRAAVKLARGRAPTRLTADPPTETANPLDTLTARELLAAVDEEIGRLPDQLRAAVVACGLEGRSQDEAARLLGWTSGQVKGRLERGRRRLADRLARRGLVPAAGGVFLLTSAPDVTAGLRDAAVRVATGQSAASRAVAALAASVGRTLPVRAAVMMLLGLAAVGLAGLAPGGAPRAAAPVPKIVAEAPQRDLPEGAVRRFGADRFRLGNGPIAVTPDGMSIVGVSPEGTVRVLDAGTGRVTTEYLLPQPAKAFYTDRWVVLAADGSTAVTGVWNGDGSGNTLTAWNLTTRQPLWTMTAKNGGTTDHTALSADGRRLVFVEPSNDWKRWTVRSVDLGTGRVREVTEFVGSIRRVHLSPDGKRVVLVTGGDDAPAGVCYDASTGDKLWQTKTLGHQVAFSADSKVLFATAKNVYTPLQILDIQTGKPIDGVKGPEQFHDMGIPPLPAPDGRTVLLGDIKMRGFVLWDYRAGKELGVIPAYSYAGDYRHRGAAFSRDGKTLFTTIDRLRRWDASTGKPLDQLDPADGHDAPAIGVRFSPDGRDVYSIGSDRRFARWSRDGKVLDSGEAKADRGVIPGEGAVFQAGRARMVFDRFAAAGYVPEKAPDPKVDPNPFQAPNRFQEPPILTVPTADGRRVLTLSDTSVGEKRGLQLLKSGPNPGDQPTSTELPWTRAVPAHPVSPCGRWIVLDGKVYSTATGKELLALEAPGIGGKAAKLATNPMRFERVWFSPDGRFLAGTLEWQEGTPSAVRLVAVWELSSGRALQTVPVHSYHDVAVSPGARTIVDGGIQGITVRDLSAGTHVRLARRDLCTGFNYRQSQPIAFSPTGRTFVTGHCDGSVIEWAVPHAIRTRTAPGADAVWADLGSAELWRARAAVEQLVDHPDESAEILKSKFAPPAPAGPPAGRAGGPEIPVSGDTLRGVRAIEVLERIGTPAAHKLLEGWRDQTSSARLSAEATFALDRLDAAGEGR